MPEGNGKLTCTFMRFVCTFLQNKVDERREVEMLVNFAQTQLQAAYVAFTH